jgi:hypothetical protein
LELLDLLLTKMAITIIQTTIQSWWSTLKNYGWLPINTQKCQPHE